MSHQEKKKKQKKEWEGMETREQGAVFKLNLCSGQWEQRCFTEEKKKYPAPDAKD